MRSTQEAAVEYGGGVALIVLLWFERVGLNMGLRLAFLANEIGVVILVRAEGASTTGKQTSWSRLVIPTHVVSA